jgi:chemosensory pili system protein ChpC
MPRLAEPGSAYLQRDRLVGLLLPLADRQLLLPNVAIAELVAYQPPQALDGQPAWHLGQIGWRDQSLPLLDFEAACGAPVVRGEGARIVILNAIGDSDRRFIALLIQGIPRSCRLDAQLSYVDLPLARFELAAVQVGEVVARVPDIEGLEELLAGVG